MSFSLKNYITNLYYKSQFTPNIFSIFINPNFIVRTGLYDEIKNYSSVLKGSILDFGCGRKPYKKIFINCNNYIGLDIHLEDKYDEFLFADVYYDGNIIPYGNKSFDNIVSFDVLQLVENPDHILSEIKRVLNDNGYFLITIPFVWIEHWGNYDLCRYTIHGIEKLLVKNGFKIEKSVKTTNYLETMLQIFIGFLTYEIFPSNKKLRIIFVFLFITPINIIGLIIRMFKKNNTSTFYHNSLILAKKNC